MSHIMDLQLSLFQWIWHSLALNYIMPCIGVCHCAVWQIAEAGFNDVFISALCCSRNRRSCTNEENIASEQLHITYENNTTLYICRNMPELTRHRPDAANIGPIPERSKHTMANSQGQYEVYTGTTNIELYWKISWVLTDDLTPCSARPSTNTHWIKV